MAGFPVVIVEKGGVPITAVSEGAPEASLSEHGGTPITLTENGAPLVITGSPIPPVPGPSVFWTNDDDLDEFETAFDVAASNVIVEMAFHYEGDPEFTITHEGEPIDIVAISLNDAAKIGCLIAIGSHLTVETGSIKIVSTGGTFGGVFGRANELEYEPTVLWSDHKEGTAPLAVLGGSATGDVIAVGIAETNTANGVIFTNLDRLAYARPLTGDEIPTTPPASVSGGWTDNGDGSYTHTGGGDYEKAGSWVFGAPVTGPIWIDVGVDIGVSSRYRQYIEGDSEKYAASIVQGNNQNFTNQIGSASEEYTHGDIGAIGDVTAYRIRWLKDPKVAGSSIYRRVGEHNAFLNNFSSSESAVCAVCLGGY